MSSSSTARAARQEAEKPTDAHIVTPFEPALQLLLSEMEALASILPPHDANAPSDPDEADEAYFDNMPV